MTNSCGVYKITNTVTGDYYIGSSSDINRRLYAHRRTLVNDTHHNRHLQRAWNKYGADNFEFTVILLCDKEHKLTEEQTLLDLLKPVYNIAKDAFASMQGLHLSEEHKRKISVARKGKYKGALNPMFGRRFFGELNHMFGKPVSEEAKHKLSEAGKGKHPSEETRRKNSDANKGELNHNFGKPLSDETRRKISEAQKGNTNSLGHKHTEETKLKISGENNHMFGKHQTEETKRKMSDAHKRGWAEKKATANLIHDTGLFDTTIYNLDIQKKGSTMTFDDFDHIDSMLDDIERAWEEQSAKETIK